MTPALIALHEAQIHLARARRRLRRVLLAGAVGVLAACGLVDPNTGQGTEGAPPTPVLSERVQLRKAWDAKCGKGNLWKRTQCQQRLEREYDKATRR